MMLKQFVPKSLRPVLRYAYERSRSTRSVFRQVYNENLWQNPESRSGSGSTMESSKTIRTWLPQLLSELDVQVFLDLPCGDWNWMRTVKLPETVTYIGADIVPEMIASHRKRFGGDFRVLDISRDVLPQADLVMVRACLIHIPLSLGVAALKNIRRSGIKWLLTSHDPNIRENADVPYPGPTYRNLNMHLPPFNLPPPDRYLPDGVMDGPRLPEDIHPGHCVMGLWRL